MLSNNDVLKRLKVAYSLRSEDVEVMLNADGAGLSSSEVSAFLRPVDDKKKRFRPLSNTLLALFLRELLMRGDVLSKERGLLKALLGGVEEGQRLSASLGQDLDMLIRVKRGEK